jgi:hypothetical protein
MSADDDRASGPLEHALGHAEPPPHELAQREVGAVAVGVRVKQRALEHGPDRSRIG